MEFKMPSNKVYDYLHKAVITLTPLFATDDVIHSNQNAEFPRPILVISCFPKWLKAKVVASKVLQLISYKDIYIYGYYKKYMKVIAL